ncbi:AAA domain-containing protein [Enterococcus avium]
MELRNGDVLKKRYELQKAIHNSSNSQIFRGYDNALEKFVVIKFLKRNEKNKITAELFRREIRSLEGIDNEYIIRLIDSGENEDYFFIVMEQLSGSVTLEAFIGENIDDLSLLDKLNIFKKILLGMNSAHKIGITHRDLNPTNVLINDDIDLKIIDFGVSKIKRYIHEEKVTVANQVTLRFASPEQIDQREIDNRTDVFSLGAVFFYILTGIVPSSIFEERMALIDQSSLPIKVIDIVRNCTHAKKEDRYQSISSILNDLEFEIIKLQASNETIFIQVHPSVMNTLFKSANITFCRMDFAYRFILKNLKEAYIYRGGKGGDYVLIGDLMKYYCEVKIDRSTLFLKSVEPIEDYGIHQNEVNKGIRIYATIENGKNLTQVRHSKYLSLLTRQVNEEAEKFRSEQKRGLNESKILELWDKTVSAQDSLLKKNENIGEYNQLKFYPDTNIIKLLVEKVDSFEKLELNSEVAARDIKTGNYRQLGRILDVNSESKIVSLIPSEDFDIEYFTEEGSFGLDVGNDKASNERFRRALDNLKYNRGENKRLFEILIDPENVKYDEQSVVTPFNVNIDRENLDVVEKALAARDLFLIQGPPGTGKTTVIEEIINQLISFDASAKILVASQSHVAVDNILEKLTDNYDRHQLVRIGTSYKIADSSEPNKVKAQTKRWTETIKRDSVTVAKPMLKKMSGLIEYPFDRIFKAELHPELEADRNFSSKLFLEELANTQLQQYSWILKDWYKKLNAQEQFDDLLVSRASIVFSTCTGAGNLGWVTRNTFDCVIIDEAAKSTLPEVLIPMVRGKKIILVGDHKQLPPIVNNFEAEGVRLKELEKSLFEDLFERIKDNQVAVTLSKQFRMHPNIAKMIKSVFYRGNILESGVMETERCNYSRWGDRSIVWLSTSTIQERIENMTDSKAYSNVYEAQVIKNELEDLNKRYNAINKIATVGVISGYNGQKTVLTKLINPNSNRWTNLEISIENIDAYQGAEVDIVFYSVVRSNNDRRIGFLKDNRRLNVSLSRAKRLLVIVGDDLFLKDVSARKHNYFDDVLTYIDRNADKCVKEDVR